MKCILLPVCTSAAGGHKAVLRLILPRRHSGRQHNAEGREDFKTRICLAMLWLVLHNPMKLSSVVLCAKKNFDSPFSPAYIYKAPAQQGSMNFILDDNRTQPEKDAQQPAFLNNIRFTADAIVHLAERTTRLNISEWIWHIEIIDGREWYIVTDKKA